MNETLIQTTDRLARIETKVDVTNEHLRTLNGTVKRQEERVRQLEDVNLVIEGRNTITGRIKAFLFTNGGSVVTALLIAYLIFKINLGGD